MYPPYLIWCGGYLCFWNIYSIVSFTMQLCGYVWSYAHHFDLYAAIRLFSAMGYWTGSFADNVSCLTSDGVLQQNRSLRSFLGVKLHVSVNCWSKGLLICYLVHTVHFRFYDSPQPFCRTIIYAMSHSGHGLFHALILELCLEYLAGILISSVAMKNRFCIRIFNKCLIISIKYELVVISFTYNVCNRKTII